MAMTNNIIEVERFSISFNGKTVIKNLSFNVQRGETFGLLGSNGCGKTTTIRALLGLYTPDKGKHPKTKDKNLYDLQGRKIKSPGKGYFIQGGVTYLSR